MVIIITVGLQISDTAVDMLNQLPRGAFLTVRSDDQTNTMTIGWGAIGFFWNRPVIIVAVRYSRYTYELIDKAQDFSVTLPLGTNYKQELAGTGTTSGRDLNKFEAFRLKSGTAKTITSPVIDNCGLVYECKMVFRQEMDPSMLDQKIKEKYYENDDYHVMYYGEIVSSYVNAHQ